MKNNKTIGIYGGAFDPFHFGHLKSINYALFTEELDEIWIVPCGNHPFNKNMELGHHRWNMCQKLAGLLQFNWNSVLRVSELETCNREISYTCNTIKTFVDYCREYKFRLIVGEDEVTTFPKWKDFSYVQMNAGPFIIVPRHENEVSSTEVRELLKDRDRNIDQLRRMVPKCVLEYILENNLYQEKQPCISV